MFSKLLGSSQSAPTANQHAQQHHQQENSEEQSLTTVLTSAEDRSNLLILVADCTHAMRVGVCAVFDPQQPVMTNNTVAQPLQETAEDLIDVKDSSDTKVEPGSEDEASLLEKQQREQQRRLQELAAPDMQALKKAALEHFDDWQDKLLSRVGEAINQKPSQPSASGKSDEASAAAAEQPATQTIEKTDTTTSKTDSEAAPFSRYPPTSTPLLSLPTSQRALILHSLLLLILSLERYHAESRILLLHITSSLHLPLSTLQADEAKVAQGLLEAAKRQMTADEETKHRAAENSGSRAWKVGLGTVAGAALIGVTGGLAAPLLAAGVGSLMGGLGLGATAAAGYLGAMAGSAPLVGALFGAYGGKMAGQSIDRYAKDVDDFAFVPVHEHQQKHHRDIFHRQSKDAEAAAAAAADAAAHRLRVAIGISGWLTNPADISTPWLAISDMNTEPFALRFELDAMMSLGNALVAYVKSYAWGWAKKEIIARTVFASLSAALWPLGLLKVARVVDNPWGVAKARADKAGVVLADALAHRVQGERPVTLIGYSLGARAIYQCLDELANRKQFGLVEDVILLGAPTPSDSLHWRKMRAVVSGRLVNVYSGNDYLLAFLYRTASLQLGVAGLQAVDAVPGVENVDVSSLVDGHTKYRYLVGRILERIAYEDVEHSEADRQEGALKVEEAKEKDEQGTKENAEDAEHLEKVAEKGKNEGMLGWVQGAFGNLGFGVGEGEKKPAAA